MKQKIVEIKKNIRRQQLESHFAKGRKDIEHSNQNRQQASSALGQYQLSRRRNLFGPPSRDPDVEEWSPEVYSEFELKQRWEKWDI
jgi:hypothetical protein